MPLLLPALHAPLHHCHSHFLQHTNGLIHAPNMSISHNMEIFWINHLAFLDLTFSPWRTLETRARVRSGVSLPSLWALTSQCPASFCFLFLLSLLRWLWFPLLQGKVFPWLETWHYAYLRQLQRPSCHRVVMTASVVGEVACTLPSLRARLFTRVICLDFYPLNITKVEVILFLISDSGGLDVWRVYVI